jgi:hypothetical protein
MKFRRASAWAAIASIAAVGLLGWLAVQIRTAILPDRIEAAPQLVKLRADMERRAATNPTSAASAPVRPIRTPWGTGPDAERIVADLEAAGTPAPVPEAPPEIELPAGPVRLAVGTLGMADAARDSELADLLVATMGGDSGYQFVERREFKKLVSEFELGAAGAIRPSDAVKLGRLLQADWFLFGSPYRSGNQRSTVVRIVDAGTGVMRDLAVQDADESAPLAAERLAAMLRRQRDGGDPAGSTPEFVAIGGFVDLSVRPRHPGVEAEMRGHLTTALAATGRKVLERELTGLLLDEIRMQQAGWTQGSQRARRFRAAFWMVDGFWQSFDSVGDQIEATVRVTRIGGSTARRGIRADRGPELLAAAMRSTEELLAANHDGVPKPSRRAEVAAQIARGVERSHLPANAVDPIAVVPWQITGKGGHEEIARVHRESLLAAIPFFESALLLDPDNALAKLHVARCLADPGVGRPDEARAYYRELMDSTNHTVARFAGMGIGRTLDDYGTAEQARDWYRYLERRAPDSEKPWYKSFADSAENRVRRPDRARNPEHRAAREDALRSSLARWRNEARASKDISITGEFFAFMHGSKLAPDEFQDHLEEFVPKLSREFPEFEPHILVRAAAVATRTNTPLRRQIETSIEAATRSPHSVVAATNYFEWVGALSDKALEDPDLRLGVLVADALSAAGAAGIHGRYSGALEQACASIYVGAGRWHDAEQVYRRMSELVTQAKLPSREGWRLFPIGRSRMIDLCRAKQSLEALTTPEEFSLGSPVFTLNKPFLFRPDGDRVWVAIDDQLLEQTLDGKPGTHHKFARPLLGFRTMAVGPGHIWIGHDEGLLEFNRADGTFRGIGIADGLLLPVVQALHWADGYLWIGYYDGASGGVSRMDTKSHAIRSFTPNLRDEGEHTARLGRKTSEWNEAPKEPVWSLTTRGNDELWVSVGGKGFQRLRTTTGEWATPMRWRPWIHMLHVPRVRTVVANAAWVAGCEEPQTPERAETAPILFLPQGSDEANDIDAEQGLPYRAVRSMALDGDVLWTSGPAYVAAFDLKTRRRVALRLFNFHVVSDLVLSGSDVWFRVNEKVYRVPRSVAAAAR